MGVKDGRPEGAHKIDDVRTLFNLRAHSWKKMYAPGGKLNFRIGLLTRHVSELCHPPANILDFGCGTGDIAAAIGQMGYRVTACDIADNMVEIARSHRTAMPVEWLSLSPEWIALPFADHTFEGIVASSVFEYLADLPRVTAELARVLRPDGVLIFTVPNPFNRLRRVESLLRRLLIDSRLSLLLPASAKLNTYLTYLRLSQNRFTGSQWRDVLEFAGLMPIDASELANSIWAHRTRSPLIVLSARKDVTKERKFIESGSLD